MNPAGLHRLVPATTLILLCMLQMDLPAFELDIVMDNGAEKVPLLSRSEGDIFLLAIYVICAISVSFLCSVTEAVVLSITPSYIEAMKEKHPRRAALLKRLKQDEIDRSLAAILTLNTIANTLGAVMAGAQATLVFGSAWFGIFSAAMTLAILLLAEIVPKTIGAVHWRKLAIPAAFYLNILTAILFPVIWLTEKITQLISRGRKTHAFSRDELIAMTKFGEQSGHIHKNQSDIIRNLFGLDTMKASDIMTPRIVISAMPEDVPISEAASKVNKKSFSRLPIYAGSIDNISGFVLKDDILIEQRDGRCNTQLKSIRRDIVIVPGSISLVALLKQLMQKRQHMALVVDEYGGTGGIVTLEDMLETILGMEIIDEKDNVEDMRTLARKRCEKRLQEIQMGIEKTE